MNYEAVYRTAPATPGLLIRDNGSGALGAECSSLFIYQPKIKVSNINYIGKCW